MRSFTKAINSTTSDFAIISKDTSTANITRGIVWANECLRRIYKLRNWNFNRKSVNITSVATQQNYTLPGDIDAIERVQVTVSGTTYTPFEVTLSDLWFRLNMTTVNGDVPEKWFYSPELKNVSLYPIPATNGNTIAVYYKYKIADLGDSGNADYTTGTITGTSGTNTVTSSGATFTATMVGMYVQPGNTGFWYEITGQTSNTLTLRNNIYSTFSGVSFTIGEVIPLPDGFEDLPVFYALYNFYASKEDSEMYKVYKNEYDTGLMDLINRDQRTARGELLIRDELSTLSKDQIVDINKFPQNIV